MADNFVRFTDRVNLIPSEISKEVRDYYTQAVQQGLTEVKPLRVKIAATHAARPTRNNGFYLPHKMRDGAATWTSQYPKPIQVHHEDTTDPIGRVVSAQYVDISVGIRNALSDAVLVSQDKLIQDFVDGNLSLSDTITFANEWIINDLKISTDPDYEGMGYIELVADITDPTAIQKILDGRYLTGSVGASTNQAICSVCKQDWAKGDRCEHRPGKIYDGMKMVIIAGDLNYDEYSFVNRPADQLSRVIEINVNGIQDFVSIDNTENLPMITLITDKQPKEGSVMTFKDALASAQSQERFKNITSLVDDVKKLVDEHKDLTEETLFSLLDKLHPVVENTEPSDPVKDFFGEEYDELVGDDVNGREYAEMLFALVDEAPEEEKEEARQMVKDAKLSSEKRKALASSTFCGPNRSFPVPDCAHYTAAKRLIGRYKGEGDKSRILACVERKGKRLGCSGEKKSKDSFLPEEFTVQAFDQYTEEEIADIYDVLQEVMKDRDMECACDQAQEQAITLAVEEATRDLNDKLTHARKEISYLHADIDTLTHSSLDHATALRNAKALHITDMKRLTGEEVELQTVCNELKDKTLDEVNEILKDITSKVDTSKIVDTLNSGLTNKPTETVENPTLVEDNSPTEDKQTQKLKEQTKRSLKLNWLQVRTQQGSEIADKWLDETCKALNIDRNTIVSAN